MTTHILKITLVAALLVPACDAVTDDNLDSIEIAGLDTAGKADSLWRPTDAGELRLLYPVTTDLAVGTSGYHLYTLTGKAGWQVSFVQKSADFRTYLRIYAPSGRRWSRSGVQNPDNGAWYSTLNIALPETGTYYVLATSYDNMHYYPWARTAGEYTLSADAQLTCAGFAALQCPDYLKCMGVADYPDASGTCEPKEACYTVSDCDGLIHPMCAIGPNGGWHCMSQDRDGLGTCGYLCGNPDQS